MTASPVPSKPVLRSAALARRDDLTADARARASAAIADRADAVLAGLRFDCLAGFLPIRSECDPRPIMEAARGKGAAIALPAFLDRWTMVFRRYDGDDERLVAAGFGTREPSRDAPTVEPDVLLVPAAGFDRHGARLGYGKGHYDRTIGAMREAGRRPFLVGLAFSVQEVDPIPVEPHDVRLDWLVTEAETFDFRRLHQ
jgi:5-formyltetrahydrofolate cyclo-ligase